MNLSKWYKQTTEAEITQGKELRSSLFSWSVCSRKLGLERFRKTVQSFPTPREDQRSLSQPWQMLLWPVLVSRYEKPTASFSIFFPPAITFLNYSEDFFLKNLSISYCNLDSLLLCPVHSRHGKQPDLFPQVTFQLFETCTSLRAVLSCQNSSHAFHLSLQVMFFVRGRERRNSIWWVTYGHAGRGALLLLNLESGCWLDGMGECYPRHCSPSCTQGLMTCLVRATS